MAGYVLDTSAMIAYLYSVLLGWPTTTVESYPEWGQTAAVVKAPARISVAGSWVAALALLRNARLVHKDPEFDAVNDLEHLRLPYDRARTRP